MSALLLNALMSCDAGLGRAGGLSGLRTWGGEEGRGNMELLEAAACAASGERIVRVPGWLEGCFGAECHGGPFLGSQAWGAK